MASRCGRAVSRKRCARSAVTPATSCLKAFAPGLNSRATGRFTKPISLRASGRRLDNNNASHVWMQRTEVLIGARRGERERELSFGIERLRPELLSGCRNRMRDIVLVVPRHGEIGLHS